MKKVEIDPLSDKLLPLKNAHKIVALEWVLKLLDEHNDNYKVDIQRMIGIYLNEQEFKKIKRQVDKLYNKLRRSANKMKYGS